MNKELIEALKVVLADTYAFGLKAQNYHWNVTGPNFAQYHEFFGDVYSDASGAVDIIAEGIRTLDAYAPGSFIRFKDLTTIDDETNIPESLSMISKLTNDNRKVLASLYEAYNLAESSKKHGISNFIQDRITAHDKWAWMLKSFIKA